MKSLLLLVLRSLLIFLFFLLLTRIAIQAESVWYVKEGGLGDGTSWANSSGNLQQILNRANPGDEIWIAQGIYKPSIIYTGESYYGTDSHRLYTFLIQKEGLKLYGGFPPTGNPFFMNRAPSTYPTVLDGNIGDFDTDLDNACHVVTLVDATNTLLNGVTITNGYANLPLRINLSGGRIIDLNSGAGLIAVTTPGLALINCVFSNNQSVSLTNNPSDGGALYLTAANLQIIDCLFSNNQAEFGGAIHFIASNPDEQNTSTKIENSIFEFNRGSGGAIYSKSRARISVTHTRFSTNSSVTNGGALQIERPTGNSAPYFHWTIDLCEFDGNSVNRQGGVSGGAIFAKGMWGSTGTEIGDSLIINKSNFTGNSVTGNSTTSSGGAIEANRVSVSIDQCHFKSNSVNAGNNFSGSGGGAIAHNTKMRITNSFFVDNHARTNGGAHYFSPFQSPGYSFYDTEIINCLFTGNSAGNDGGAIWGGPRLTNVTISGNTAQNSYGGVAHAASVRNTIIYGNTPANVNASLTQQNIFRSLVENRSSTNNGNLNGLTNNPLFLNASNGAGDDEIWGTADDGFLLQDCSPAINSGLNTYLPKEISLDLSNRKRIQLSAIDMGAYESSAKLPASLSGALTITALQPTAATHYYLGPCNQLVAKLTGDGTETSISGVVTVKLWIMSQPIEAYVRRHHEITPSVNSHTATGRVTLCYSQEDFDIFNSSNEAKLPTGPTDLLGKSQLIVEKRGETSMDESGLPGSYTGTVHSFRPQPEDIVWNAVTQIWEVSFDVSGFSGFFLKSQNTLLPLSLLSFSVREENCVTKAFWTTERESNVSRFEIQKSKDGKSFETSSEHNAMNTEGRNFYWALIETENLYIRLKITDIDGTISYSKIIAFRSSCNNQKISVYPNPTSNLLNIQNLYPGMQVSIFSQTGVNIYTHTITNSELKIDVSKWPPGIYYLVTGIQKTQWIKF